mmetsp:Transcript_30951/g.31228  ORF Transcript_30951/g.31228 Transcript_30951/m.31228 type:complete len:157 (-) Transcript_30951:360-830(-)
MPFYITMCVTVSATGLYKVPTKKLDGAPPPTIIHLERKAKNSKPRIVTDDTFYPNHVYSEGLGEAYNVGADTKSTESNPCGFTCRATASTSMTQQAILDFAMYFVRHLSKFQRINGLSIIIFLDGHSSCWDVAALLYLMRHNIFLFFIASRTSVWD